MQARLVGGKIQFSTLTGMALPGMRQHRMRRRHRRFLSTSRQEDSICGIED
jgi:hypothetical protein